MLWTTKKNRPELAEDLAASIVRDIEAAIEREGQAAIALSGGSTPTLLFEHLASTPARWPSATVAMVDERWTDDGAARNETLIRRKLLQGTAAAAQFVAGFRGGESLSEAVIRYQAYGRATARIPPGRPFDVTVLGMGADGHTASLFPDAPELSHALETPLSWASLTSGTAPHPRLSMTLSAIEQSRRVILHIEGNEKQRVLEAAMMDGAEPWLPIRHVAEVCPGLQVWWAR